MSRYCCHCLNMVEDGASVCPECNMEQIRETPTHHIAIGTILRERYVVGKAIGEGGFGITYIGKDLILNIKVAIKEFFPNGYVNRNNTVSMAVYGSATEERKHVFDSGKEKFLNEARILAMFSKEPGIVDVKDFFEANNTAYIVMEFLEGHTLKQLLAQNGCFAPDEIWNLFVPLLLSLKELHKHDLIHRDISPENIMYVDNRLKLLDFGAARNISATANKSLSVMLKPGYAPEEQYRSRGNQGAWTDVYALSATLYKCITGITPDDSTERIIEDNLKLPSALGISIEPGYEKALMKGLGVLKKDRFQSISELIDAVEETASALDPNSGCTIDVQGLAQRDKTTLQENELTVLDELLTVYEDEGQTIYDEGSLNIKSHDCLLKTHSMENKLEKRPQKYKTDTDTSFSETIDEIQKVKFRGRLVEKYNRILSLPQTEFESPVEIQLPDGTVSFLEFCDEFDIGAHKKYTVARQKDDKDTYMFFVLRTRCGKNTLVIDGVDQLSVYLNFINKYRNEYIFIDEKFVRKKQWDLKTEKNKKRFTQGTVTQLFATVDDIPQILYLPEGYNYICANSFSKLCSKKKEIRQIIVPDSVELIEDHAFDGLVVTEAVFISKSLKTVARNAFHLKEGTCVYCEGYSHIQYCMIRTGFPNANVVADTPYECRNAKKEMKAVLQDISNSKGITRIKSETLPLGPVKESVEEISIPQGVYVIDSHAFDNVKVKKRIIIPASVVRIGTSAFDLMSEAYVECPVGSYAYLYCRENGMRNSVDISNYKAIGVCVHCGGSFTGLLKKRCSICGRKKDY